MNNRTSMHFAGDEKEQELCALRSAKSMDMLLDTLLDMSVAAFVDPNVNLGCSATIADNTSEAQPISFRSPFNQADRHGAYTACSQEV